MSIDSLQNMISDYQVVEAKAAGIDLDPSDAYAIVFRKLGWSAERVAGAISDMDTPLEELLLEAVSPPGYAESLLREAILEVLASAHEKAAPAPRPR